MRNPSPLSKKINGLMEYSSSVVGNTSGGDECVACELLAYEICPRAVA